MFKQGEEKTIFKEEKKLENNNLPSPVGLPESERKTDGKNFVRCLSHLSPPHLPPRQFPFSAGPLGEIKFHFAFGVCT